MTHSPAASSSAGPTELRTRFGAQLWSQATDWPGFRDAALAAEASGWDGVWTWDHLLAIQGDWRQPIFEGWAVLAGIATLTSRVTLGLMVGANTFRNPAHVAKLATTLDHMSGGRAVLGIGGAWFEREHDAFGIDFGTSVGERLDWLEESVALIRRLLDGERFDHDGPAYHFHDAELLPRPIQEHLPILVGGSGPKKTLRTVARHADAWNTNGTIEEVAARDAILREHCAAAGRDSDTIEREISFPMLIRDRLDDAERAYAAQLAHNTVSTSLIGGLPAQALLGSPARVADALRPYRDLGFRHVTVRLPAPYDHETLARIDEVRTLLDAPAR